MHSIAKLSGTVRARFAAPQECSALLNDKTVELAGDMLVIADDNAPVGAGRDHGRCRQCSIGKPRAMYSSWKALILRRKRLPATASPRLRFWIHPTVSSAVSIMPPRATRWSAQRSWSSRSAAVCPAR